ncbi:MAG: outer membrane protein transport protein [Candidatus Omnitrophica bacterium]|nr:outer membrane protein transport protein [Candidatus Omnitrophota bacterium]
MIRKSHSGLPVGAAVIAACLIFTGDAYASNGSRMLGFSARDSAMAGATTASSEDTACLVKNPAGLVNIGNRVDLEYQNILPHDVTVYTEGPGLTALLGLPLVNPRFKQESTVSYIPGGDFGVSYGIPGEGKHPVAIGCGVFNISGLSLNLRSSRLNPLVLNDYDKMIDLKSMRIAPGAAIGITDKLSVGAAANIEVQALRTDMATTPNYFETVGGGKWSFAPGAGFTVGMEYEINRIFAIGASYESHTWMRRHYRYKDCLPYIDEPPVINAGLSFKPAKQLELTFDTRYINWTDVKIARLAPDNGGFGWRDQWVFATGAEYGLFKDRLKLRLGYNYGRSQIQPHVAFANSLLPLIMEHHLTNGFSYALTKKLSVDLTWEHHFFNSMADKGWGDITSQAGAGSKISAAVDVISVGASYKY